MRTTRRKQEYRKIKSLILSARNPILGAQRLFYSVDSETINRFKCSLICESYFSKSIVGKCTPAFVSKIDECGNMPYFEDLEKAVIWSTLGMEIMSGKINEFLILRKRFDHAFLFGEYEECLHILDESHNCFGYSLWEIKNHIAVLSQMEGLESQRKYADNIRKELDSGSAISYLIFCASKQCEANVSVATYLKDIQEDYDYLLENDCPIEFCRYVKFMANGSGAAVLTDSTIIDEVTEHNRKFLGFDMEAYGVMLAGYISNMPKTVPIVVKSVSDFGDGKDDRYQKYASYTSAKVVELLINQLP